MASTWPRYCTNENAVLGEKCSRYGEPVESGSDAKKTRGHGATYRCKGCGYALSTRPPEDDDDV